MELLVLTQNAWGGAPAWPRRRQALARQIARVRPDVVGLQEVHSGRGGGPGQVEELAGDLPGYTAHFAAAWTKPRGVDEGVGLLVRHPLLARAERLLTQAPGDRLDRLARRVVLGCTLGVGGRPLDVLVTHLSLSAAARGRNVGELNAFAAELRAGSGAAAAVLLGDFNAAPGEHALRALEALHGEPPPPGWRDAWAALHGPGGGRTWPAPLPLRRLDYVYVRGAEVLTCERLPPAGSDHRAVAARLRLPG